MSSEAPKFTPKPEARKKTVQQQIDLENKLNEEEAEEEDAEEDSAIDNFVARMKELEPIIGNSVVGGIVDLTPEQLSILFNSTLMTFDDLKSSNETNQVSTNSTLSGASNSANVSLTNSTVSTETNSTVSTASAASTSNSTATASTNPANVNSNPFRSSKAG